MGKDIPTAYVVFYHNDPKPKLGVITATKFVDQAAKIDVGDIRMTKFGKSERKTKKEVEEAITEPKLNAKLIKEAEKFIQEQQKAKTPVVESREDAPVEPSIPKEISAAVPENVAPSKSAETPIPSLAGVFTTSAAVLDGSPIPVHAAPTRFPGAYFPPPGPSSFYPLHPNYPPNPKGYRPYGEPGYSGYHGDYWPDKRDMQAQFDEAYSILDHRERQVEERLEEKDNYMLNRKKCRRSFRKAFADDGEAVERKKEKKKKRKITSAMWDGYMKSYAKRPKWGNFLSMAAKKVFANELRKLGKLKATKFPEALKDKREFVQELTIKYVSEHWVIAGSKVGENRTIPDMHEILRKFTNWHQTIKTAQQKIRAEEKKKKNADKPSHLRDIESSDEDSEDSSSTDSEEKTDSSEPEDDQE